MLSCGLEFPNPKSKEVLKEYAVVNGYENVNLTLAPGSAKGDNFVGIIFKVNIKGSYRGKDKELNVIVKAAPVQDDERQMLPMRQLFLREIYTYKEIIPTLEKLQRTVDLNDEDLIKFASCLTTSVEDLNEFIVMQDLSKDGYRLHEPRIAPLDYAHLKLAISSLAKFHALSFVLKTRSPIIFNEFCQNIPEIILNEDSVYTPFINYLLSSAEKCSLALKDKNEFPIFQRYADNIVGNLVANVTPSKYSVICHGDYWKNNVLFRYKNTIPDSVIPLDFQIVRHSSPATDILYLIFNCTSQEFRKENYFKVLDLYYDSFRKYLLHFQINSSDVFSKEEFMNEIKRVGSYALGMAVCVLPFMACPDDEIPSAIEGMKGNIDTSGENFNIFRDRLCAVLQDCIELGYIS